jgi:transcriptional regulator with PAS, ATPase and Fis domain
METQHEGQSPGARANGLADRLKDPGGFVNIIGKSQRLLELFRLIEQVAASDANILIQGESGTGKELVANAIHARSRPRKAFVKINCAAMPAELIESELFGYKKGAFTGATLDREGLLGLAENGSLLLDEIGEMPSYLQTKLLRVLQERAYRPLGSEHTVHVSFRLLTATNTDVEQALRDGKVREDLYFRINTIVMQVPPLRERADDIPLLCAHFLEKFRQRYRKTVQALSPEATSLLLEHAWPGNVRELENAIERAVLLCKGRKIAAGDLPESLQDRTRQATAFPLPPGRTLAELEKAAILQTLNRTNWNKQKTADALGLYRASLSTKMKKHGIRAEGPAQGCC